MEDLLIETLKTFGFPVILQGSLHENDPYPDEFFTFWNDDSNSEKFYDNIEHSVLYVYDVNFYSVDAANVYDVLREAKEKLKANGFIISGDGHSIGSDEPTHDGRGITVKYLRRMN